jgi:hypothetical protein
LKEENQEEEDNDRGEPTVKNREEEIERLKFIYRSA